MHHVIQLKSLLLWLGLLSFSTTPSAMMPVIDAASLAQLGNQLSQLKIQTQAIQQSLQTLSGDQYQWSQTQGIMNEMREVMQKSRGIAQSSAQLEAQFQHAYPGYQAPDHFANQYQENVNTTQQTFQSTLQSLALSERHFDAENQRLAFLQQQTQNAQGQTQAIQALSQIASEMVSQQQLLRQAILAQSNAQMAYYAHQVQQEASSRAELAKVIQAGVTKTVPTSGTELDTPDF